jgi:predicted Zn-dependent protease
VKPIKWRDNIDGFRYRSTHPILAARTQEVEQRREQLPRRHKRKYLAFGCENPIQLIVALATPFIKQSKFG